MNSDSEASGEREVSRMGQQTKWRPFPFPQIVQASLGTHGYVKESAAHWVALVFLLLFFLSFFFSPSMWALRRLEYAIWNLITSFVLTTVLIFLLPSDALMRHLLSAGSNDSAWPFRGAGLVLPSYFFSVITTLPDVLHFWNSRVSSVRNESFSSSTMILTSIQL